MLLPGAVSGLHEDVYVEGFSEGIALFVCDEKHIPCGVYTPFQQHTRQLEDQKKQLSWTEPFKKRLWQQIIVQKIKNQAFVLKKAEKKEFRKLLNLAENVKSGDADNKEGQAARIYFNTMLEYGRRSDAISSKMLDYGYAVLRGAVARSVAGYGFIPSLGIFHRNELNTYNLTDDMIEAFRPFLDDLVFFTLLPENDKKDLELTLKQRTQLVEVLSSNVIIHGEKNVLLHAVDICIMSLRTACETNDWKQLHLPEFQE